MPVERPSDDAFRLLVESVQDYAIFLLDPDGIVASWNPGAQRFKGYRAEEIIGHHFSRFYTPEDKAEDRPGKELEIARREGRVEDEGWRLRQDGTRFWANVVITALRKPDGSLLGFAKVTRDLTERKLADEALRSSEERFRLIVESVRDYAIFMLDPKGIVLSWNAGAERMKGYTADEIIGQHFSRFYPPEDIAAGKTERELEIATAEGRYEEEGWRLRKDGTRVWANVIITRLLNAKGELVGFAKVTRDLTERREAERRLLAAEIDRARSETRAEDALGKVRARDEFISIASHELRTPLAAARLHAESLRRHVKRGMLAPERAAAKLDSVVAQIDRLEALTGTLLDASRIALSRLGLDLQEVDLAALTRSEVQRLAPQLKSAGCAVHVDAEGSVVGRWDPVRLEQVLVNLLTNAMKYGAGKPIDVDVGTRDGKAFLRVTDRGIGVAPDDQARIFNRFERAVSQRHFAGLGLGLWITRQIVEALDGSIAVASEPGKGATFTVELPR